MNIQIAPITDVFAFWIILRVREGEVVKQRAPRLSTSPHPWVKSLSQTTKGNRWLAAYSSSRRGRYIFGKTFWAQKPKFSRQKTERRNDATWKNIHAKWKVNKIAAIGAKKGWLPAVMWFRIFRAVSARGWRDMVEGGPGWAELRWGRSGLRS